MVVSLMGFGSLLFDSADRRLVSRVRIICKLSCGAEEFGVESTEPVAYWHVNGEFCIVGGGMVAFRSRGFGGMVLWVGSFGVFDDGKDLLGKDVPCFFRARN